MKKLSPLMFTIAVLGSFYHTLNAAGLFSESFDSDPTADWAATQGGGTDSSADFYFDYSTIGIPPAPNSTNGTTRGMRFLVNQGPTPGTTNGVFQGINASPIGQSFTGDYRVRFDMWLNFNGPLPGGGNGSTQCGSFGVGASGSSAQWAGGNPNAILFGVTADGGSTQDYRCYSNNVHMAPASGVYAAGTGTSPDSRNDLHTYYATFGGKIPPTAQTTLYPNQTGTSTVGAAGFAWRDVILEKVGDVVTWTIDGKLVATCQTPASFLDNIFFGAFDINATASTDANDFLIASIFDNIRVESVDRVVSVSAPNAEASETGSAGEFSISRSGDTSNPLTVDFTVTGTAVGGEDYTNITTSVTLAAGEASTNFTINPIDDSVAEFTENVLVTITPSTNYLVGTASASVLIIDNEMPELSISVVSPTMYESVSGDYARFQITRKGESSASFIANISYAGTAESTRYTSQTVIGIDPGSTNQVVDVFAADDAILNGDQTIIATIEPASGNEYLVGTPASASVTILDNELPAENVLFSDPLTNDTSLQWTVRFGANNLVSDYSAIFGYDVTQDNLPPAPNGATTALKVSVNKDEDTTNGAAGLNLYPNGQSFSGNFALRFSMYMVQNVSVGTTEFALMGINHSGAKTNWMRQSGTTVHNNPPVDSDGLWFSVISDASASAPGDFCLLTGTNAASSPSILATAPATAFTNVFKKPPYSPGAGTGVPGNLPNPAVGTRNWADVEIKKVENVVTLSINRSVVLEFTNNTAFNSGNIMLGYTDPYESIGTSPEGVLRGATYYSNVRVISLPGTTPTTPNITSVGMIEGGTKVQIDFTGGATDSIGDFTVQGKVNVTGTFTNETATISSLGSGSFRATLPVTGTTHFYRIAR